MRIALVILSIVFISGFEILDPHSQHPLLKQIAQPLHEQGIDVVQDWKSNVSTKGRPVLAPLANYDKITRAEFSQHLTKWDYEFNRFLAAYNRNDIDMLLCIPAGESGSKKEKWDRAAPEKRVFISFAREDHAIAENIRSILEKQGFEVFTFLEGLGAETEASMIAHYMATAKTRLVIDTEISRTKWGVLSEALANAKYKFQKSENLSRRIAAAQEQMTKTEFPVDHWKRENPRLTERALQRKINATKLDFLNELKRGQKSGGVQIAILIVASYALSVCTEYDVPKMACPTCSQKAKHRIR